MVLAQPYAGDLLSMQGCSFKYSRCISTNDPILKNAKAVSAVDAIGQILFWS